MTILNKADCEKINQVVDYIIQHPKLSVAQIKRKFHLSSEEYDMISDLMMPAMRYSSRVTHLENGIRKLIRTYENQVSDYESDDENEDLRAS